MIKFAHRKSAVSKRTSSKLSYDIHEDLNSSKVVLQIGSKFTFQIIYSKEACSRGVNTYSKS